MKRLPDSAPGKKPSCEVYGNCLEALGDLLDLLEHLVQDHILAAPDIKELNSIVAVKPHDHSPLVPPELCVENLKMDAFTYSLCTETGLSKFNESPADSDSLGDTQDDTRLQALVKFVAIALEDGTDFEQACCAYLRLDGTSEEYEEGVDVLSSFNTCFESADVSGSPKQLDFTYALEIPKTRWDGIGLSNSSGLLFDILRKKKIIPWHSTYSSIYANGLITGKKTALHQRGTTPITLHGENLSIIYATMFSQPRNTNRRRILINSFLESGPGDVRDTLSDRLDRQGEPRGPYHLAVEGCLKLKASLASVQRRDPKMELDYNIRKVIYTTVVKHLEQNLSYFRNHKKLLGCRNVQVADRLMKSASEPAMNCSPPIQQIKVNSEAPEHPDTAQKSKYTIGWVRAIAIELAAVKALLDEEYDPLLMHYMETNVYVFGRMGKHNIVIACLPAGKYGTVSAATVASEMRWHFPDIRFYLMVGVGGGVPSEVNDIRLGDVVVSLPTGISGGVIQYEFGKTVSEGKFQYAGSLNAPPPLLLNALTHIRAINTKRFGAILEDIILSAGTADDRFSRPVQDRLFVANYDHLGQQESYEKCDPSMLIDRKFRENNYPYVHYGIIASGDKVIKHGATRDRIGRETGALCFEMEAAGLIHSLPCLVVRGICDYSDNHQNKEWQPYATVAAAAFIKKLLSHVPHLVFDFNVDFN
ncbi:hypothetical protein TWF225_009403 [Orbilia oligospora]|nr:hypothetical protein TWF225_009403 [Orbilia oligospora]KAF3290226.1 hypothetical protein TWF132_007223 [Orbilia oligospora]